MLGPFVACLPANVVPALVSFAMIYAYTRLLSVDAYGDYSLAFSAVLVVQAALFTPLKVGAMRLCPKAQHEGTLASFYATVYACLGLVCLGALVLGAPLLLAIPWAEGGLPLAAWLALPLLLLRGAVATNQGFNRIQDRYARYNAIECTQAVLGLACGLGLILWVGPGGHGADAAVMGGLLIASAVCLAADLPVLVPAMRRGRPERGAALDLFQFGGPLAVASFVAVCLQYSDRFVVGALGGVGAVGVYVVAYGLVERPTTLLCTSVATVTFPLAVQSLEQQGMEAARLQVRRNGAALLALLVPACLGLTLSAPHVAAVLVGPDYRAGVSALVPIMAFAALARGLTSHFVEHAFHLARRPDALVRVYGLAALANIALDVATVPFFGVYGAAWAAVACQIGALAGAWVVGRRLFPLSLPWREVAPVLAASAAMTAALLVVRFPETPVGLVLTVALGGLSYGASLLAVSGRRAVSEMLRGTRRAPASLGAGDA